MCWSLCGINNTALRGKQQQNGHAAKLPCRPTGNYPLFLLSPFWNLYYSGIMNKFTFTIKTWGNNTRKQQNKTTNTLLLIPAVICRWQINVIGQNANRNCKLSVSLCSKCETVVMKYAHEKTFWCFHTLNLQLFESSNKPCIKNHTISD